MRTVRTPRRPGWPGPAGRRWLPCCCPGRRRVSWLRSPDRRSEWIEADRLFEVLAGDIGIAPCHRDGCTEDAGTRRRRVERDRFVDVRHRAVQGPTPEVEEAAPRVILGTVRLDLDGPIEIRDRPFIGGKRYAQTRAPASRKRRRRCWGLRAISPVEEIERVIERDDLPTLDPAAMVLVVLGSEEQLLPADGDDLEHEMIPAHRQPFAGPQWDARVLQNDLRPRARAR